MGADIHCFAEVKKYGKWEINTEIDEPFGNRNYGVFGFLADVRNYCCIPRIAELKGLPNDSEYLNSKGRWDKTRRLEIENDVDYHSCSYLTLKELIDFDYTKTFENLRYTETYGNVSNGAAVHEKGEGEIVSFEDYLGATFFRDIEILKILDENPENVRVVFYFDN